MELVHGRRTVSASFAAIGLVLALAACGTDSGGTTASSSTTSSSSSSSTTTSMSQACQDASNLKSSIQSLTTLQMSDLNQTKLNGAITKVKSDLDAAVASASGALKPQVDAVKTAADQVQTAATGMTADNYKEKLPAVLAAVQQLGAAATALGTTLQQSCPGM